MAEFNTLSENEPTRELGQVVHKQFKVYTNDGTDHPLYKIYKRNKFQFIDIKLSS